MSSRMVTAGLPSADLGGDCSTSVGNTIHCTLPTLAAGATWTIGVPYADESNRKRRAEGRLRPHGIRRSGRGPDPLGQADGLAARRAAVPDIIA